jgi:hypothetical protein
MPEDSTAKPRRRSRPLCHAAKISDYRFRKVLWHFVRDQSATDTASATHLSLNSVVSIFRKLRVFFWEVGLFTDIYEGQDPLTNHSNEPVFEKALLEFHFQRVRDRQGLKSPAHEPDYHFAESHWRFHFQVIMQERASAPVNAMMFSHLLELIRLCGPVGIRPRNRRAGMEAVMRQMDQRVLWLERNAPGFSATALRSIFREIRSL